MYPSARGATTQSRPPGGTGAIDNRPPGRKNVPTVAGASGCAKLHASLPRRQGGEAPFTHKNTDNAFTE